MKKEVKTYIVEQKGGLTKKGVRRYKNLFCVGARNAKEAIQICKKTQEPYGSYRVRREDTTRTTPHGACTHWLKRTENHAHTRDPLLHEAFGRIYLKTDETRYVLTPFGHKKMEIKYVAIHSRGNNPIFFWA